MAELHYTKDRQLVSANSTTLFPDVNALFGPWESFEVFNTWFSGMTDVGVPSGTKIGIVQPDNTVKVYRYGTPSGGAGTWVSVEDLLNAKQDTINDLSTIRSGAAAGATALQRVIVTAGKYTSVTTTSKAASFKVPTNISHLENDTGFVLESTEFSSEDGVVYRIVDDLDFDGAEIELGANTQLIFEGGSISNVTIIGSNTSITAAPVQIFGDDVILEGTWNCRECYPEWWGAVGDGSTDDTDALSSAINSPFNLVKLLSKTYIISYGLFLPENKAIEGITVANREASPSIKVSSSVSTSSPINYMIRVSSFCTLKNFNIYGNGRAYHGIYGASTTNSADGNPHKLNIEGMSMYHFKIALRLYTFLSRIVGCSVTGARVGFMLLGGTSTTMINCYVKGFMMMAYYIKSMTYSSMINCCADTCHAWSDGTRSGSTNPTQTESADTVTDAEKQEILGDYYYIFYGFTYLLNQCSTITMISCACEDVVKGIFLENSHVIRIIGTTMDMQGVTRTSDAGRVLFSQISNHVTVEGMYVTDWAGNGWETQSDKILAFYSGSSKYNVLIRNFQMRSYNTSHVDTTWFLKDSNIRETGNGENTITVEYDRWKKRGVESAKPDNLGWIVGKGYMYYNTTKKIAEMWTGTRWVELICNDDSSFYTFTTENISKAYDELETYNTGWTSGSSLVQDVSDQEWKLMNGLFYNAGIEEVWDGSLSNDIGEELPTTIYVPDEGTAMSSVWFRVYEGDIITVITTRKGDVPQASPTLLITDSDHHITYRKLSSNIITGYDDNDEPIYDMETLIEDRVTNYEVLRDGYGFVSTAEGGEDTFYLGIRRTVKTNNINARLTALESSMPVSISLANFQTMMDNETYTEGTIYNVT